MAFVGRDSFRTAGSLPSQVPWSSVKEWTLVADMLFAAPLGVEIDDYAKELRLKGIRWIRLWQSRRPLPIAIEATASLMELSSMIENATNCCTENLRLSLALAIIRFINGLVDHHQTKLYASSVSEIAKAIGIPQEVVDIRHQATHNQLPTLSTLMRCSQICLDRLRSLYWDRGIANHEDTAFQAEAYRLTDALGKLLKSGDEGVDDHLALIVSKGCAFFGPSSLAPAIVKSFMNSFTEHCQPSLGEIRCKCGTWFEIIQKISFSWPAIPSALLRAIIPFLRADNQTGEPLRVLACVIISQIELSAICIHQVASDCMLYPCGHTLAIAEQCIAQYPDFSPLAVALNFVRTFLEEESSQLDNVNISAIEAKVIRAIRSEKVIPWSLCSDWEPSHLGCCSDGNISHLDNCEPRQEVPSFSFDGNGQAHANIEELLLRIEPLF